MQKDVSVRQYSEDGSPGKSRLHKCTNTPHVVLKMLLYLLGKDQKSRKRGMRHLRLCGLQTGERGRGEESHHFPSLNIFFPY